MVKVEWCEKFPKASSPVTPTTFPMTDMVNLITVALKLQSDAQAEQMRKERNALAEERNGNGQKIELKRNDERK